jgi:hypothetical protein
MTIAAGVVGDLVGPAAFTTQYMPAQRRGSRHCSMADITLSWARLK